MSGLPMDSWWITRHWRQYGMIVRIVGDNGHAYVVQVVSAGNARRELGERFTLPHYMLETRNCGMWSREDGGGNDTITPKQEEDGRK